MILRGLAGVLIGALYGSIVTVLVFLLTRIGLQREQSSLLIMMDPVGLAWLATVLAGITTGITGILLGLIVGLTGVKPRKAAAIGLIAGLVIMALLILNVPEVLFPRSLKDVVFTFATIVILPVGLAVMAQAVAFVCHRLKAFDL